MRIATTFIAGVSAYVVVLLLLGNVVKIRGDSVWYFLPFIASVGAVLAVAVPWQKWRSVNQFATVATTVLLGALVVVFDLAAAVWYSCAKGVCL